MVRTAWVVLSLVTSLPLAAANWQEMKQAALARLADGPRAAKQAGKVLVVDCTKGESVQAAIDRNASPIEIEIHGLCVEAVVVRDKVVTLRGSSPATDGLKSPSNSAAVTFIDSRGSLIENLAFNNNPLRALALSRSSVVMTNCTVSNNNAGLNPGAAVTVLTNSLLNATAVTASNNGRAVFNVVTSSELYCHGCAFSNNGGLAASSSRGSLVSLLNSTVTQRDGIQSFLDAYVDIDCVSEVSAHPCSMQALRRAGYVELGGIVAMYGAGDFTGRIEAHDRGSAQLYGARQLAGAAPGQGPAQNIVSRFGTLEVYANFDVDPPVESRVLSTNVSHFGRMLVRDQSDFSGAIVCTAKGDAWLDPTVVQAPGSSVTGCD